MARSYTRPPRLDQEDPYADPAPDQAPLDLADPTPEEIAEYRARKQAEHDAIQDAAKAFTQDWSERDLLLKDSPVIRFLKAHEVAGSPNELTITGVADVRVSLGDLRAFVRGLE